MSDADEGIIEAFLDALWMERGLSENTLKAYRADLVHFARFASARRLGLLEVERGHVLDYLVVDDRRVAAHHREAAVGPAALLLA